MSKTVRKGAYRMMLRDANQLAAFLNNGWEEVNETETQEAASEQLPVEEPAEEPEPFMYTKTDINRMKADAVIELAKQDGIDITYKSGTELKKILIAKHNL